jgi:hypothetical protein
MNLSLHTFFLILALVFFILAAFGAKPIVNWTNAGYAAVVAAFLF